MKKYVKENLIFSRKENIKEYLIYSAKSRGVYIVPRIVWLVWDSCNNNNMRTISNKVKISEKKTEKIVSMLLERALIKII